MLEFIFVLSIICIFSILCIQSNFLLILVLLDFLLLLCALNYVFFSQKFNSVDGYIYALIILNIAAAESVLGVGFLIFFFKVENTLSTLKLKKFHA